MIHGKLWNQISLLKLNEHHRLIRKSVFNIRGNDRVDYFPSYISMAPEKKTLKLISPEHKFIVVWNSLIVICSLFLAFYIPFVISFEINDNESYTSMYITILLLFVLDLVIDLNIALYNNGNLIFDRRKIIKSYVKGWFLIDFFGILSLIIAIVTAKTKYREIWYIQIIRLGCIGKLFKVDGKFERLQDGISSKLLLGLLILMEIIIKEILIAHFLACAFYALSRYESRFHSEVWINSCYLETGKVSELYVTALYWSITTLATVGYGDIKAKTDSEFIFVIFSMVLACIIFGYVIGNLEEVIVNFTGQDTRKKELNVAFNSFCDKNNIPDSLKQKAKTYLSYIWQLKQKNETNESEVLQQLSTELQELVCVHSRGFIFNNFFIFSRFDKRFLKKIMLGIVINCYSPEDIIFENGEKSRDLYYITKGKVFLEDAETGCYFMELDKFQRFGDLAFFLNRPRCCTVTSKHFVEVFTITWESFSKALEEDPESQEFVCKLESLPIADAYLELRVDCYLCGSVGHIIQSCPSLDFGKSEFIGNLKAKIKPSKKVRIVNPVSARIIRSGKRMSVFGKIFENNQRRDKTELTVRRPRHSLFVDSSDEFEQLDKNDSSAVRSLCFNSDLVSPRNVLSEM